MTAKSPHILCVNPWIHDFAAYDAWARPMGLLYLAAALRNAGCRVTYIDCLDRFHPKAHPSDPAARNGRGPFRKTRIPTPTVLRDVPRKFSRYGIDPEWFADDLKAAGPPDLVLVTSLMTYWYTGVRETIAAIKRVYPQTPVVLGGIYATLCEDHAREATGADAVIAGPGELRLFELIEAYTGARLQTAYDPADLDAQPYPAFDLQRKIGYVPLLTARGCPYRCAYCASHVLQPERRLRSPEAVAAEIDFWHRSHGVQHFAFYDDALLVDAEELAVPLLEKICALKADLSFHTPNALHIRHLTPKLAGLMRAAGFQTARFGVETTAFAGRNMDEKVKEAEFFQAAVWLREAGFDRRQLGAYLLAGLPGQDLQSVYASIDGVKRSGITPVLAFYTPIPHTRMWDAACAASRYDLCADPLCTNNAVMPCWPEFDWKTLTDLKQRILE